MTLSELIKLAFEKDQAKKLLSSVDPRLLKKNKMLLRLNEAYEVAEQAEMDLTEFVLLILERRCRNCGCTDMDCSGCIEKTGQPCTWVEQDLCSACDR